MLFFGLAFGSNLGFALSVGGFGLQEDILQLLAGADRLSGLVEDRYCLRQLCCHYVCPNPFF
jgi:hypothetical protein